MHMKMSSANRRPSCPGGDELTHPNIVMNVYNKKKTCAWLFDTHLHEVSLQPTRPLGRVSSKFNWQCHRENMPTWLPWPPFHTPLHNSTPIWGPHTSMNPAAATNRFYGNFANNCHWNSIQISNLCAMFRKAISKSLPIINVILSNLASVAHLTIKV